MACSASAAADGGGAAVTAAAKEDGGAAADDGDATVEATRVCESCGEALARGRYSQKMWRKPLGLVCRRCYAARHGDTRVAARGGRKPESGVDVRPNNWGYCNYVDAVFKMRCFGDLAACGALSSAKDVSESMAVLHAAKVHGACGWRDTGVVCLCVGDGAAPRTGSLAAFVTAWRCISVDPALRCEWAGDEPRGVRRLAGFRGTIDEYMASAPSDAPAPSTLVVLLVHSHARLVGPSSLANISARFGDPRTVVVALPCCARVRPARDVGSRPDVAFYDECVFSEKRRVEVWAPPPAAAGRPGSPAV